MARRWLLDLTVGGQVLRFASSPATVQSDNGTVRYTEGLAVEEVSPLSESIAFALTAPTGSLSWADRIGRGQLIEGGRGVLRLHTDGETLEESRMVSSGYVTGATWGGAGSPLRAELRTVPRGLEGTVPPAGAVVIDGTTWPRGAANIINEEDAGRYYPIVFGYPGADPNGTTIWPAYRAPLVLIDNTSGSDYWIIGDREIVATDVALTKVDSSATPPSSSQSFDGVTLYKDAAGRTVTTAYTDPASATPANGLEYWCGHSLATGGGLPKRDGSGPVRTAGEVIERLLIDYSEIPVDKGRMRAASEQLQGYKLDGFIDKPIATWDFIQRAILPLLPALPRWSDEGFYLAVMDYEPTPSRVTAYLNADREDVQRTSDAKVRYELLNTFRIDYGKHREGFALFNMLTGDPEANAEKWYQELSDVYAGDIYCLRSQARYGYREADPIESAVLWDRSTALRVLRWMARRHALPLWGVQYVGGPELAKIEPGAQVELTDSDMGWSSRIALVEDVAYSLGETVLELSILPDLVQ